MEALPIKGRLLGIDPGAKTYGLAITDRLQHMAHPLRTLKRGKWSQDKDALLAVMHEQEIVGIVVGYPRHSDGSEGVRCQAVRAFVRNLEGLSDLPIYLQDEGFTTAQAEELLGDSKAKSQGRLDAAAAAIILGDYLKGRA